MPSLNDHCCRWDVKHNQPTNLFDKKQPYICYNKKLAKNIECHFKFNSLHRLLHTSSSLNEFRSQQSLLLRCSKCCNLIGLWTVDDSSKFQDQSPIEILGSWQIESELRFNHHQMHNDFCFCCMNENKRSKMLKLIIKSRLP